MKDLSTHSTASTNSTIAKRMSRFEALAKGNRPKKGQLLSTKQSSKQQGEGASKKKRLWKRIIALPSYYWVLLVQIFVMFALAVHMPIWLTVYGLLTAVAQLPQVKSLSFATQRIYQVIQMVGFAIGLAGLWLSFGGSFGVDVGVAFLVLCLISKLWEVYKRRDAYVVLNLSLFVFASLLLLDQGLVSSIEALLGMLTTLFAFISLNDDDNINGSGRLRSLALLAGQALPLLVVLFIFFPRLPPLWSLQLSSSQAVTGVSDSMSPGDFVDLGQSTELAFRAEFDNTIPAQSQMYWRGLVFNDFDGVTWSRSEYQDIWWGGNTPSWLEMALQTIPEAQKKDPDTYNIILEPTQQRWLYGLDYPLSKKSGILITSVFTLQYAEPIQQQLHYDVGRYPDMHIDIGLSELQRKINLALPEKGNEQSRQIAQTMFEQSERDPIRYINTIQSWINGDDFSYTLSPPALGDNRVDDFLFVTQAGFCEHYASSFTFLMRAAGIPARVVAGYQGGQVGRDGASWEVRQMDAHAWSEVWLDGQGWVRVDPTSFVAPMRIEQGMNAFTEQQGATVFGDGAGAQFDYQRFQIAQSLQRLSDQASYYWQRDIVGYDQDKQSESLFEWFKIENLMQQMFWMIGIITLIMSVIISLIWYRRRKRWHPVDRPLMDLSKRMAKNDGMLAYQSDEGILDWLQRIEQQTDSNEKKQTLSEIQTKYRQLRYGRLSEGDKKIKEYQQAIKELNQQARKIK